MNHKFHVITRCSRQENLVEIYDNIFSNWYDITWHIIFDTTYLNVIDAQVLKKIESKKTRFYFTESTKDDYLYPQLHLAIDTIGENEWICFLDDDNLIHPDYFKEISNIVNDNYKIFVVDQYVGGKDFTGLETRVASKENNKLRGVDIGQLTFHRSVFRKYRFGIGYTADGQLVDKIMAENPDWFFYINKTLSYYNYIIPKEKTNYLPKVLLISSKREELKTVHLDSYFETDLSVIWTPTDANIKELTAKYKPDSIVAISDDFTKLDTLCKEPRQIRDKWITLPEIDFEAGNKAYHAGMYNILKNDNSDLVSYFTPVHNIGDKVFAMYDNIAQQTHTNWEWVIVNDSLDGGKTQIHLDKLKNVDPRVKVYDFGDKTSGIIGEAKYRAAMLCNGHILIELDHDDEILPNNSELIIRAAETYPDAGFFYTDAVEVNEDKASSVYGEGFACGYGKYRKVKHKQYLWDVAITPNINPKTIRHIVGVPNHTRAWRKDVYHAIGGHNRNLAIADDYELIVRTFLHTKMVKIPAFTYIQNMHKSNTQDARRRDIQRRVATISEYYNEAIKNRFEQLGVEDWAYKENPNDPLSVSSRYGSGENYVNYILNI